MAHIERRTRANGQHSYRAHVKHGLHGRTVKKTFRTKREALAWSRSMEGSVDKLRATDRALAAGKTLRAAIESHLTDDPGRDRSKASRLAWWAERYGHLPLAEFTDLHVIEGLDELAATTNRLGRLNSPATCNRYHVSLSACLEHAREKRWVLKNVARGIKRRREPEGRDRWLDDGERARLFEACRTTDGVPEWFGTWVLFLVLTGCRRGEATALTWGDVDLERAVATLRHTKNGRTRVVPLLPDLVEALRPMRGLPAAPVFPMPHYWVTGWYWEKVTKAAGLTDVRMHDLRHTAASILAQSNASDLTIAALLGHSTLQMVKRYSHHRVDAVREQLADAWSSKS